jgi:Rieske Fe-S protein
VLEDPCGGSRFAIDGHCLSGPCPRNLDEFAIVERDGLAYADLAQLEWGAQRGA